MCWECLPSLGTFRNHWFKTMNIEAQTFSTHFSSVPPLFWATLCSLWGLCSPPTCTQSLQSCLTLCNPMDCSPPGSSVYGILQAGILEWVAISSSGRSPWLRDQTCISYIAGRFFTRWATWEAHFVPRPRLKPGPRQLKCAVLSTEPPGNFLCSPSTTQVVSSFSGCATSHSLVKKRQRDNFLNDVW